MKKTLLTALLLVLGTTAHAELICQSEAGNTLKLSHGQPTGVFQQTAPAEATLIESNGIETGFTGQVKLITTRVGIQHTYTLNDEAGDQAKVSVEEQILQLPPLPNCMKTRLGCIDHYKHVLKAYLQYHGAYDVFTCQAVH